MIKINCLIIVFISLFYSCTKNKLGGNSIVSGKVMHHEKPIPNAKIYIKFNAKEFPGKNTSLYDTELKADATGNYTFKCYKGNYYLYSEGTDVQASPNPNLLVYGGLPINIRTNETLEKEIAVSE